MDLSQEQREQLERIATPIFVNMVAAERAKRHQSGTAMPMAIPEIAETAVQDAWELMEKLKDAGEGKVDLGG
jgi:hypothetical protein